MGDDWLDDFDNLSEGDKSSIEDEIIDEAFYTSYLFITQDLDFEDLLKDIDGKSSPIVLAHDPNEGFNKDVIIAVIKYYSEEPREDYDKCIELRKVLHEVYPETIGIEI